ncbi:HemK methyltransferase family member 1 [Seminavis robusta]|uniref:HemK methyltransferase family member 1 n=1 Tax=Seminavis robusta TaxID=568900 RepID=A0A9N8DY32_9STRA|nr:HemK methyltransferase family member 1 [Seminavis robusta]|eukprot:Sro464_g148490.1 HemK methyltransferase family member 1 (522) ;mRNA; f:61749-63464
MAAVSSSMNDDNGNPQPDISVVQKYEDYCVLLVTRGFGGPQEIQKWLRGQEESACFRNATDTVAAIEKPCPATTVANGGQNTAASQESNNNHTMIRNAVLLNYHCKAYARGLVLAARNKSAAQLVSHVQLTVQCLCKGYLKPQEEQQLEHTLGKTDCQLRIKGLQAARSNTLGYISLVQATNLPSSRSPDCTFVIPRQFRRQLKASGFPVLGHTKDCQQFRGESLCMSVIKLQFQVATTDGAGAVVEEVVCIERAPRLKILLEREERFWKESNTEADVQAMDDATISKPTAYIAGKASFLGHQFFVNSAVMIPRPGSEAVVQRALELYQETTELRNESSPPRILDLGTGSGCLLLSLLRRLPMHAVGVGVDKSTEALKVSRQNAMALGLAPQCTLQEGDFGQLDMLALESSPFDIVVCNPPYHTRGGRQQINAASVAHEPSMALFVEHANMLVHYRDVLQGLKRGKLVHRGTVLVFEVCKDNAKHVGALMQENGLELIRIGKDAKDCVRTAEGVFRGFATS